MKTQNVREITSAAIGNILVFLSAAALILGFVFFSASLSPDRAQESVRTALLDGALTNNSFSEIELIPGFLVMESDGYSTCVMLSQMLAPSDTVFGTGLWTVKTQQSCAGIGEAVMAAPSQYNNWYRYWHGASAVSKITLSFLSVHVFQILLISLLGLLSILITWRLFMISRQMGVAYFIVAFFITDTPWQGLSLVHGISTSIGLGGVLLSLIAFERSWTARWAVVLTAGFAYAVVAQMLVPMAFAIQTGVVVICVLVLRNRQFIVRMAFLGASMSALWVVGYGLGLVSRYIWVAFWGPGWAVVSGEVSGTSGLYRSSALSDPFYALVGLLMKTWLNVGWMQVGLFVAFGLVGWMLAKGSVRNLLRPVALITLMPSLLGVGWLAYWSFHTNHTFVHALLAAIFFNVFLYLEVSKTSAEGPFRFVSKPPLDLFGNFNVKIDPKV